MRLTTIATCLAAALSTTACASMGGSEDASTQPRDFAAIQTEPSPRAKLYADCMTQAGTSGAYGRAHDDSTELFLFTCTGEPARAFWDALGPWSAETGSEASEGGRVYRSTNPVIRNLFGVDYCSTTTSGADHRCIVSLNAGEFLKP